MMMQQVLRGINPAEIIQARTGQIYAAMLSDSPHISQGNFEAIGRNDLSSLFNLYDKLFFSCAITQMLSTQQDGPLNFRLSSTMTRTGGKTTSRRLRLGDGTTRTSYEIAIASRLLFMNFNPGQRPVSACGLICLDRLQALQRIMEHEIIHLMELLTGGDSNCAGPCFKQLAQNIFGHTDRHHTLISTRELAAVNHAIRVGTMVEFEFQGVRQQGRVNRIHHRATVLVPSAQGLRYSDGHHYRKFYIPVTELRLFQNLPATHASTA